MPIPYIVDNQTDFIQHTDETNTQSVANFLPGGEIFRAKNIDDSNFRKLLRGLSKEFGLLENKIKEVADEHYVATTVNLLEQWESALGIPDNCFKVNGKTIEERHKQIITKLALSNIITRQDFIDLAAYFGIHIEIEGGALGGVFPLTFPILFSNNAKEARFTMVIKFVGESPGNVFPLKFPIKFTDDPKKFIKCLFEKLKPANVKIIYQYIPP